MPEDYWWLRGKHEIGRHALERAGCGSRARILDIGCGGGQWAGYLKSAGYGNMVVLDGSVIALAEARKRGLTAVCARVEQLPFKHGAFDVVTAMDIIEHVENDAALAMEVRRALARGGAFLIHVPAHPFLFSYWDRLHGHFRRYTRESLQRILVDAHFPPSHISYAHAVAFVPAVLVRKAKSLLSPGNDGHGGPSSDFVHVGRVVNTLLTWCYRVELMLSRARLVPFGLSLVTLVKKDA